MVGVSTGCIHGSACGYTCVDVCLNISIINIVNNEYKRRLIYAFIDKIINIIEFERQIVMFMSNEFNRDLICAFLNEVVLTVYELAASCQSHAVSSTAIFCVFGSNP